MKNEETIQQLLRENKELKKLKEQIITNKKASHTAGLTNNSGAALFDNRDKVN